MNVFNSRVPYAMNDEIHFFTMSTKKPCSFDERFSLIHSQLFARDGEKTMEHEFTLAQCALILSFDDC